MARKEREYSHVTEAETIVKKLCDKYNAVLWQVFASQVVVLGIENSERSEKNKILIKTRPIKGVEKAVLRLNNIKTQYVIELYWSDWHSWGIAQKQWLILSQLLHLHRDGDKLIKSDCVDFKILIDVVGVDWVEKKDLLPNLLDTDVKFDLSLRPGFEEDESTKEVSDDHKTAKLPDDKVEAEVDETDQEESVIEVSTDDDGPF